MEHAFTNREIPRDQQQSGAAYVAARMKDGTSNGFEKLAIADVRNCGHTNRICVECAHEWAQDYELLYNRTAAGRRLQFALKENGEPGRTGC